MSWPNSIARKTIVDFAAYSARGGSTGALHLDANESPWAPPPVSTTEDYNRYPEQQPAAMRSRLADMYGVSSDQLMIGRGADEAIEVLIRTFCEAGKDNILICPPTFGYFKTAANIQGAGIVEAALNDDYTWDKKRVLKCAHEASSLKIVFLCSPNNPTGNEIQGDLVEALCSELPETLIVVDEAYREFSDAPSYTDKRSEFQNLIVLRTLSKVYGLAGVRAGVAIADSRVIDLMLKVLPPYPIPRPVEKAVMSALSPAAMSVHEARLDIWKTERARMASALLASPFVTSVYPSSANFLLLDIADEDALISALNKRHVKIRDFRAKMPGKMRISIGTPEENDIALAALGVGISDAKSDRVGEEHRKTKETDIAIRVNLDDSSIVKVDTGIGFYDHMLESFAKHGNLGLVLTCKGDLEIDPHHTIEDCALALGTALKQALGNKAGIGRFGFVMPMDETQAQVAIDLSGRPAMTFKGEFPTDRAGEFPAEMCPHFFESLAQTMGAAIQIEVEGENTHHMIEASFKGVAKALAPAFKREGAAIPSTKGVL